MILVKYTMWKHAANEYQQLKADDMSVKQVMSQITMLNCVTESDSCR